MSLPAIEQVLLWLYLPTMSGLEFVKQFGLPIVVLEGGT